MSKSRFTYGLVSFLILTTFVFAGTVPRNMSVQTLTFEDGASTATHQTLVEDNVLNLPIVSTNAAAVTSDTLVYSGTSRTWYPRSWAEAEVYAGNTLEVAESGKKYTTITDALTDASAGDTILIYPGTYAESFTISTENVSLLGVLPNGSTITEGTNTGVIISKATSGVGDDIQVIKLTATSGATVLANLTVINTSAQGVGIAQEALNVVTTNEVYINNCSFYGEQDTVFVNSCTKAVFRDCYIEGQIDVLSVADDAEFYNCSIYDKISGGSTGCVWLGKIGDVAFTAKFIECTFNTLDTTAGTGRLALWGESNTTSHFINCSVLPNCAFDVWNAGGETGTVYVSNTGGEGYPTGTTFITEDTINVENNINVSGNIYGADDLHISDDAIITGTLTVYDDTIIYNGADFTVVGTEGTYQCKWNDATSKWEFSATEGSSWDVNLYHGGAGILKTDDAFEAASLKAGTSTAPTNGIGSQGDIASSDTLRSINGLEVGTTSVIDSSRNVYGGNLHPGNISLNYIWGNSSSLGLRVGPSDDMYYDAGGTFYLRDTDDSYANRVTIDSSNGNIVTIGTMSTATAIWQDFSSMACSGVVDPAVWVPTGGTHVTTAVHDSLIYFPVPFLPGSVITQIRVKWQAIGDDDGVSLRLVKRDESGITTAWVVVGAQQSYTDPGTPYPVTVSTYDVADETMSANTTYAIEVEAVVITTGSNLYAVGVETNKRVY